LLLRTRRAARQRRKHQTTERVEQQPFVKTGPPRIDSNISTPVNADMQVGAATEVVEVTASAVALQSETATLGKLVTEEQIKMMQLNGRNPCSWRY